MRIKKNIEYTLTKAEVAEIIFTHMDERFQVGDHGATVELTKNGMAVVTVSADTDPE